MKNKFQIFIIAGLMVSFLISNSIAQVNLDNTKLHESKTFAKNKITVIQSLYLNKDGLPSRDMFLKANGLSPINTRTQSKPFFVVSFFKEDVLVENGKHNPSDAAELLNLDFYVETITSFNSINVAVPIWDGRVYEDDTDLIVGGYSSKFNERPVGKISSNGQFDSQLDGVDSNEFPILQIPAEQIIFDPFEWRLLRINSSKGETIKKNQSSFLPINIFDQQGKALDYINYELVSDPATSTLILFGILDGKKIELANCDLAKSEVEKNREGYQPKLIEGCSQPANGKVVTLTFRGKYSSNISINGTELYLNDEFKYESDESKLKTNLMTVDGDFTDWRNISGVSDIEGDYVSYLFANPDTDLLEFKITNDDKYLYLYSRVVGAHGRTGEKGRYYWYSYIDVDQDASTGYPPTRDDNCYFGIPIGDDSEAQFEFIGNRFVKTFFGFTGIGAEKEVLSGELALGPSFYSPKGRDGTKRDSYKIEYVNRENSRFITHDYTEGTSEDIIVALSPDGSEVEVKVELNGFLQDKYGTMLMYRGKKIDIALGVEGSSNHYGSDNWGADSSPVIYGYTIK